MTQENTITLEYPKPRDAWDTLSMKEKAEMIGVAVRNGITNLNDIRDKYNEFAEGGNIYDGESQLSNQMITTGGAGYLPDNYGQGSIDAIRRRLYRNITPFGYHAPISRTFDAVVLNQQDDTRSEENKRIKDSVPEASALDAIWATYLNIPENQRRAINSKYGISKTKDGYYRFNNPKMVIDFERDLSSEGLYSLPKKSATMMNGILGNYAIGLGRDDKGDYIFYSDSKLNPDRTPNIKTGWDINPYSNTVDDDTEETTEEHGQYGQDKKDLSYKIGKALFGNIEDISMGIGTPVPIYDRIYLDDYYGLSKEQQGGHYLPEITVYGSKHSLGGPLVEAANEYKKGGSIHIKPSHRGRLTELKERTGKTEAELYNDGNPAHKKMVVFARNARRWKHGLGGNLFDGTSQPTQKMNIFRRPSGEYFYQASPESEEITVVPRIKVSDNPAYWTYVDASGKLYTPKQTATSTQGEVIQTEAPSTWENIIVASNNNYMDPVLGAPARWKASWDNNTNAIRALWDNPAVMGHPLGMAAKAVEHLAGDEGISKTIRLYQNSDGSDNARWLWQRSLAGDALEFLGLLPAIGMGYNAAKPTIDRTVTTLQNNYPALFDPYTSWDATLGYHGDNIFSRAIGTVGRRYGYTPKAGVPEFHRRLTINRPSQLKLDEEGNMIISSGRTGEGHDGIVNFATSEPARGHSSHKSLSGIDDYIIDSKAIGNQDFKSIQPSDTFFETGQLAIDPKSMTLVSGNTEMLDYARSLGMRTLSSPRLRQLSASRMTKEDVVNSRSEGITKFLQNVGEIKYGKGQENAGQIGEEMQRLTSMRGTPTMQDYSYFEGLTGLNSGVRPAEMWNGTKEQGLELFGNWGKPRRTPIFNHVAYAPASNIEAIYREAKLGIRPWEDYYAALERMPSARQQLGLNSAMDTYLGETIVPENFLTIKPQVRTRVGDVEIDNPLLTYRQGDASMGADFLNTGVVSMKNGSYDNPMFAQGKLFYGSPSEVPSLLDPSSGATKGSRSGRVFLLRKPKDMTAKSDLLVSDIDMANANKDSHIVSPYNRIQDEEGNIIVTKVNEDIRRVPFTEEPATSENTTLYRWKPNYGYKKVDSTEGTYVVGNEIVDDAGNLNINVDDLLEQIKTEYPYTLDPEDLINKGINGSTDLSEHIQAVVQSAQTYPLPKGVSRKEFVTAALYHDLGKVFGDFGHGTNSAIIASELNFPITRNAIKAISQHMNQQEYFETASQLEKALHAADVGRGMNYEALIEKYPYLKYDTP